jgi:hypothetical protein
MSLNWILLASIFILGVLTLVSGVFLVIWMTRLNRKIFNGQEISLRRYFVASALNGLCVLLIFLGCILLVGFADKGYAWSVHDIQWIVAVGFIGGIFIMLGSLWSYFIAGKFRELLYQKLNDKYKK